MASRRDVRESFYSELETAASGQISADNISQEYPNSEEQLPAIVHTDRYRDVPWNINGGPTDFEFDNNDKLIKVHYSTLMEAVFDVQIVAQNEQTKEDVYEAVRTHFEKYEHPPWDVSDIQSDVHSIDVSGVDSQDNQDREPRSRSDVITISLGYERYYTLSKADGDFDTIDDVDHLVDADNNGTVDSTYNTT